MGVMNMHMPKATQIKFYCHARGNFHCQSKQQKIKKKNLKPTIFCYRKYLRNL